MPASTRIYDRRRIGNGTSLSIGMKKFRKLGPVYLDEVTIEYGRECQDCLRWSIPLFPNAACHHCPLRGVPTYPNRVRFYAVRQGISLREVQRRSGVSWASIMQISQGRCAPHNATRARILTALGFDPSNSIEAKMVFPRPRRRNRTVRQSGRPS